METAGWPDRWATLGRPLTMAAAAAFVGSLACEDATGPRELSLPNRLLLMGEAEATAPDGRSIACFIDILLEIEADSEETTSGETWIGTHGGHVGRGLLDEEGSGFTFDAFVGGEAQVRVREPDELDVIFPANENVDSRFWAALHTLAGTFDAAPEDAEGTWSCAPFDITEGYVDTAGIAIGTWRLEVPQD